MVKEISYANASAEGRGARVARKLPSRPPAPPETLQSEHLAKPQFPELTDGRGFLLCPPGCAGAFTEHPGRSLPCPDLPEARLPSSPLSSGRAPGVPAPTSPAAPSVVSRLLPLQSIITQQPSARWRPLPLVAPWDPPPSWYQNTLPSLAPGPQPKLHPHCSEALISISPTSGNC